MIEDLRCDLDAKLDRNREKLREELRAEFKHESEVVRADIVDSWVYLVGEQPDGEVRAAGSGAGEAAPAPRPPAEKCHRRGRFWVIPAVAGVLAWLLRHRLSAVVATVAAVTSLAVWLPLSTPAFEQPTRHTTHGQDPRVVPDARTTRVTHRQAPPLADRQVTQSPTGYGSATRSVDTDGGGGQGEPSSVAPSTTRHRPVRKHVRRLLHRLTGRSSTSPSQSRSPSPSHTDCAVAVHTRPRNLCIPGRG